jgi:hypothetical protein
MSKESNNPSFNFKKLRNTFKENPWLAHVTSPIIQIIYIQAGVFCLVDQHGDIFPHEEFKKLVAEIDKFYQLATNQDITDSNNFRHKKTFQSSSLKRKLSAKYVYLISKGNGHFKIGITSNPKGRLSQIRIVEPNAEILHNFWADDAFKAESILHCTYKHKNIGGEWFSLSGKDILEISTINEYKNGEFIKE